jgi:arginine N-succinyltransferase
VFLIRQSKPDDASTLHKLARMVFFINLPPDEQIIKGKIEHSVRCFKRVANSPPGESTHPVKKPRKHSAGGWANIEEESDLFMFSIEDPQTRSIVGTCQVRAHQGGPGNPNWSLRVSEKKFHSPQLGFGTTHAVGQLYADETGPTELGGLIIQPSFRGHQLRPGRFLSFIRFHFIGLHRALFADRIIAEMAPPVTSDGDNAFWDHFGRKFIPVRYSEADRFCQHNRRFISELFPKDEIFLTLFPLEILNMVGVVARETIPARRLLESLGFRYRGFVDPFDAAPHIDAFTDDIALVKQSFLGVLGKPIALDKCTSHAMVSTLDSEGDFRAIETPCTIERLEIGAQGGSIVRLPQSSIDILGGVTGVRIGSRVGATPLDPPDPVAIPEPTAAALAMNRTTTRPSARPVARPAKPKPAPRKPAPPRPAPPRPAPPTPAKVRS